MHSPADFEIASGVVSPVTRPCSIASVTVAYNGAAVLRRHLDSLKQQSRQLDEIIVVDNASTDDTLHLLASEYPEVTVLQLPKNVGIGAGLAAGLTHAVSKKHHDWVWTFDQDSLPSPNALEHLLAGLNLLGDSEKSTAILAPVCTNSATGTSYPALSWQDGRFLPVPYSADQSLTFVDMVISSGSLMRGTAIAEAGPPRADFFMDFVDYELCLRFRHHGFCIAVVHNSTVDHAIGEPTAVSFLGRSRPWTDHAPWREYYMTRNEVFTIWTHRPKLVTKRFVFYRIGRHAFEILLFGKNKLGCLQMIWRGLRDGLAGRLGPRFLPPVEQEYPVSRKARSPIHDSVRNSDAGWSRD